MGFSIRLNKTEKSIETVPTLLDWILLMESVPQDHCAETKLHSVFKGSSDLVGLKLQEIKELI